MKRNYFIMILLLLSVFLTGCRFTLDGNGYTLKTEETEGITDEEPIDIPTEIDECPVFESDFTETTLLQTRDLIRESNIFITVNLYNRFANIVSLAATGLGSGVIYKEDAIYYYALSNYHVINPSGYYKAEYIVTTLDDQEYTGTVVAYDPEADLAVIRFLKQTDLTLIDLEERKNVPISEDEFLLAVGNPSGVQNVVTFGAYLGMSRIGNVDYPVIHHSVLIYRGNSGGALTDIFGNLVGINTWGEETDDESNFAIPLNEVFEFLEEKNLL